MIPRGLGGLDHLHQAIPQLDHQLGEAAVAAALVAVRRFQAFSEEE